MIEKRAVLFDLDGTLLDTLDDITDAINHVIGKYGYASRNRAEVRSFVGNGAKKLVERAIYSKNGELDTVAEDDALVEKCFSEFKKYYKEHVNVKTKAYDGICKVLDKLVAQKVPVAVVSNKPDASAKALCDTHFSKYVSVILGDAEGRRRKPDPQSIFEAMSVLGCSSAIYVGDSETDIAAASNANIPCVSVSWGFRDKETLIKNGAKIIADNADELYRAILSLLDLNSGENDVTDSI